MIQGILVFEEPKCPRHNIICWVQKINYVPKYVQDNIQHMNQKLSNPFCPNRKKSDPHQTQLMTQVRNFYQSYLLTIDS